MTERGPQQPGGWTSPGWTKPGAGPEPEPAQAPPPQAPPPQAPPPQAPPPQAPPPQAPPGWGGPPPYGAPPDGAPPYGGPPPSGQQYGRQEYGAPPGWGGPVAGAPRPGVVPLRPLGLGELLDGSVGVVRRYPRPTLGLSVLVALVSTALGVLLLLLLPDGLFSAAGTSQDLADAQLGGALVGAVGTVLVTGLAGIVLAGVITVVVGRAVLGQPMSTGEAWRAVRPLLGRLVGLALVTGLVVVGALAAGVLLALLSYTLAGPPGLVLGVPLGIAGGIAGGYLYVRLSLAAPALVLEKVGIREALRRSGVLVDGSFWRVLGILLLAALIAGVIGQVLQAPFVFLGGGAGLFTGSTDVSLTSLVLAQIGAGVAQTLTAPFTSGVRALLYVDRRMRAEGLDVALAAAAAAPRP